MSDEMRFGSAVTFERDPEAAAADLARQIGSALGGRRPDLSLIFLTPHHAAVAGAVVEALAAAIPDGRRIGCTGEGVIGRMREIEGGPAIAMAAASLPGVGVSTFELMNDDLAAVSALPGSVGRMVDLEAETRLILTLADPFDTPIDALLTGFNDAFPGVPMIGGLASGVPDPGVGVLFVDDRVHRGGAVGVALSGPLQVDVIVSQGCRPIGPVVRVTEAERNVILALEGQPALHVLQRILEAIPEEEQRLLGNGLFLGRAIDPEKEVLSRGDFLIRGVMGIDEEEGSIVVGDLVRSGEPIRFHLRDATTATEDLEMLLTPHSLFERPRGGFLFSCNGRGTRLYGRPDGDVTAIGGFFEDLPLAGFFCAGEIGPVGGKNFLHGHTASLALIRPAEPAIP
jgi:small ligand-binding sensory domain FIST